MKHYGVSFKTLTYGGISWRPDLFLEDKKAGIFNIRAANGKFLSSNRDEPQLVLANNDHPLSWEAFALYNIDNHTIALKSDDGHYVSARLDDGNAIQHIANEIKAWEIFEMVALGNDSFMLKACNNKFVERKGEVLSANADNMEKAEHFILIKK